MLKPIEGFDGKCFVSDDGDVYSVRRQGHKGGFVKQRVNNSGYLRVSLSNNGENKAYFVHRLVAKAFIPNPENKQFVNHKDGNKTNNHVSNLEWCTKSENMQHAVKIGLVHNKGLQGEKHPQCKISDEDARKIIELRKSGVLSYTLAKEYGVSGTTIRNIVYGRRKFSSNHMPESWMITK